MKYALLLYGDEKIWAEATPEQAAEMYAAYDAFGKLLRGRDALLDGDALETHDTALTLRKRDGQVLRTDGPFVETVEHLGGYYLVEARDLDEAIEFAKACPAPIVEVRPVASQG